MKWILLSLAFLCFYCANGQVVWKNGTNWRLYKIQGPEIFSIPIDTLTRIKSYTLSTDSMRDFLYSLDTVPSEVQPTWMGEFLVTCVLNGQIRKIEVSVYGGFFYDQTAKRYFQLPANKKNDWLSYITTCYSSIE
jgi:hypothetical protein